MAKAIVQADRSSSIFRDVRGSFSFLKQRNWVKRVFDARFYFILKHVRLHAWRGGLIFSLSVVLGFFFTSSRGYQETEPFECIGRVQEKKGLIDICVISKDYIK